MVVATTSVAVPEPPGTSVTLAGFTAQPAFVGAPEQVSAMEPLNVALAVRVNVATTFWPRLTVAELGVAESVKAGVTAETVTVLTAEELGLKLASPL